MRLRVVVVVVVVMIRMLICTKVAVSALIDQSGLSR